MSAEWLVGHGLTGGCIDPSLENCVRSPSAAAALTVFLTYIATNPIIIDPVNTDTFILF